MKEVMGQGVFVKDISVLYMENRQIMAKIKTLNKELDEFSTETQLSSCDDSLEDVDEFPDVRTGGYILLNENRTLVRKIFKIF